MRGVILLVVSLVGCSNVTTVGDMKDNPPKARFHLDLPQQQAFANLKAGFIRCGSNSNLNLREQLRPEGAEIAYIFDGGVILGTILTPDATGTLVDVYTGIDGMNNWIPGLKDWAEGGQNCP